VSNAGPAGAQFVYVLHHVREVGDSEDTKLIGVYRTEDAARAAIERLSPMPGFRNHPNGFHIDRYELDKDHWAEGFALDD
jgi:homoserine kinase type II